MSLSSRLKGLRFMQRAMGKANTTDKDRDKTETIGTIHTTGTTGTTGAREGELEGENWIAKASTSACVVLRGTGTAGGTEVAGARATGRLKFGGNVRLGGVELSERERVVAEQMQESKAEEVENTKKRRATKREADTKKKKKKKRTSQASQTSQRV